MNYELDNQKSYPVFMTAISIVLPGLSITNMLFNGYSFFEFTGKFGNGEFSKLWNRRLTCIATGIKNIPL